MNQRTATRKLRLALHYLRALITQGMEFPDAHFLASSRYQLTEQQDRELMALYDTTEADREGELRGACTLSNEHDTGGPV